MVVVKCTFMNGKKKGCKMTFLERNMTTEKTKDTHQLLEDIRLTYNADDREN